MPPELPRKKHKIRLGAYTRHSLHPEEKIVYIAHVHWIVYMGGLSYVAFAGLFSVFMPITVKANFGIDAARDFSWPIVFAGAGFLFIGLTLLLGSYIRRHYTELAITDRRLIAKRGRISRESYEVMLDRLSGVHYHQTTIGRLLDYGDLQIMAAGATVAKFDDMDHPHYFTDLLEQIIERKSEKAALLSAEGYLGPEEPGGSA